jgi:predicted lipid-binding transport protein (Tim44 family)
MSEFAYADLLVLAAIAGFILLRLRNNLGKEVGFDPREKRESADTLRRSLNAELADRVRDATASELPTEDAALKDICSDAVRTSVQAMAEIEPGFRLGEFLEGAKGAYEWVFNAFHKGDKATLKSLLSNDIYSDFEAAIAAREIAGNESRSTLVAIQSAEVIDAELQRNTARITVRFASEQIQVIKDKDGNVVEGDVSTIHPVEDEWVFERELGSRSPNWTVIAT